jgi:hypothetical protein
MHASIGQDHIPSVLGLMGGSLLVRLEKEGVLEDDVGEGGMTIGEDGEEPRA